jgi:hypothetical protein
VEELPEQPEGAEDGRAGEQQARRQFEIAGRKPWFSFARVGPWVTDVFENEFFWDKVDEL